MREKAHIVATLLLATTWLAGCTYVYVTVGDLDVRSTIQLEGGDRVAVPKAESKTKLGLKHPGCE